MKVSLSLVNPASDNRAANGILPELNKGTEISIYNSASEWAIDDTGEERIFMIWLEYGKGNENTIMFDTNIDDLEEFASAILKKVEIVRKDYSDIIKEKTKKGHLI